MFSSEHNPSYIRKYFSNSHVAYVMHHLDDSLELNEDSRKILKWTLKNTYDKHKLNNFLKYIRENGFPLHDHISDASSFNIPQDKYYVPIFSSLVEAAKSIPEIDDGIYGSSPGGVKIMYLYFNRVCEQLSQHHMNLLLDKGCLLHSYLHMNYFYDTVFAHVIHYVNANFGRHGVSTLNAIYKDKLPSSCFLNYYPSGKVQCGLAAHVDHVCFCSVIVKISDEVEVDSECLSIQYLGKSGSTTFEYVDHMLSAYEGVIFGRLSHKVTFSARSSDRISLVLFY